MRVILAEGSLNSLEGVSVGMAKGMAKGVAKGKIEAVISLVRENNWSLEKAMQVLKIDDAYKDEIKVQLKNMHSNN